MATGNDWRAIEAGAHAYASRSGSYTSLSTWSYSAGDPVAGASRPGSGASRPGSGAGPALVGSLELPMAVGIVGGATRVHPLAQFSLRLMDVASAASLAEIVASVGLAQNLAAIRALATEGIQKGHMALHARQIATAAGAASHEVDAVSAVLVAERKIRVDRAKEVLAQLRSGGS